MQDSKLNAWVECILVTVGLRWDGSSTVTAMATSANTRQQIPASKHYAFDAQCETGDKK